MDDVDSLTEDDLKSIAMEQMETAQETNETEKARWWKSRQIVQFYFCFVNFQNCSQGPASRIQFQNYDSDISLNFKFYRSFWAFFSLKTNLIGRLKVLNYPLVNIILTKWPDCFTRILPSCFRLVRDCSCPKTAKESRTCQLSKEN